MSETFVDSASNQAERDLICACARTTLRPKDVLRINSLLTQPLDWQQVVKLADSQRVIPLVYCSVSADGVAPDMVPQSVRDELERRFFDNLGRNLFLVEGLKKVVAALEARHVRVIPFKGPVTAQHAYGKIGLRQFGDLDLLVQSTDRSKAVEVLEEIGFRATSLSGHEQSFQSHDGKIAIDLHWGIYRDRRYHLNPELWWERCRRQVLFDVELLLFSPEDRLMVHCVNAAKCSWDHHLRSVCDIAELVRKNSELDWTYIDAEMSRLRIRTLVLAGIWLAEDVLDTEMPPCVSRKNSPLNRRANAQFEKLKENVFSEKEDPWCGKRLKVEIQNLDRWQDGLAYRWHQYSFKFIPNERDRAFVKLPRVLSSLYFLVRPVRLLLKYGFPGRKQKAHE